MPAYGSGAVACGSVGTDIYGGIEYRHPGVGSDWYQGDTWLTAISLFPLYDEADYAAFACLFGVRNYAGFRPLAADRGLPGDLSAGLRTELGPSVAAGDMEHASWVSWAELAALDPAAIPEHHVGRLTWSARSLPSRLNQQLVPAQWPVEVREAVGPPLPAGIRPSVGWSGRRRTSPFAISRCPSARSWVQALTGRTCSPR